MNDVVDVMIDPKTMTKLANKGKKSRLRPVSRAPLPEFRVEINPCMMDEEFKNYMYPCAMCVSGDPVKMIEVIVTAHEYSILIDLSFHLLSGETEEICTLNKPDGDRNCDLLDLNEDVLNRLIDEKSLDDLSTFIVNLWNGIQVAIKESGVEDHGDHARVGVR